MADSMPRTRRSKSAVACNYCRLKKVKCNGGNPCPNCIDNHQSCTYLTLQRRRPRGNTSELQVLRQRLAKLEAQLPHAADTSVAINEPASPLRVPAQHEPGITVWMPPVVCANAPPQATLTPPTHPRDPLSPSPSIPCDATPLGLSALAHTPNLVTIPVHTPVPDEGVEDDGCGCCTPEETSYEYYGPGSFITLCSKSGIQWVTDRTGETGFARMARKFMSSIWQQMQLSQGLPKEREPDPDELTALRYSQAYFDELTDPVFGVVCRTSFEARLRAHFNQKGSSFTGNEDPAWYALRHTVFAAGCRHVLSTADKPSSFTEAHRQGWNYFQNALSVCYELLLVRSSVLAVQALVAMMFYTEAIGTPALDHMLCSYARRLAESKGLHRSLTPNRTPDESDLEHRKYIWWAIYCYEVHTATRFGRPLAIDLDSVTCGFPSKAAPGSTIKLDIVSCSITHAQISHNIVTKLAQFRNSKPNVQELVTTISQLDQMVESWRKSLPSFINPDAPLSPRALPAGIHPNQVAFLIHGYYRMIIQLHSVLFHPWNRQFFDIYTSTPQPELKEQIMKSTLAVVEASRRIIQLTRYTRITPSTHKWMAVFSPLIALINLFIYILRFPTLPSTHDDIASMQLVAGHFDYYAYITHDHSFSFATDIVNLARSMVLNSQGVQENNTPSNMFPGDAFPDPSLDLLNLMSIPDSVNNEHDAWSTILTLPDVASWARLDSEDV